MKFPSLYFFLFVVPFCFAQTTTVNEECDLTVNTTHLFNCAISFNKNFLKIENAPLLEWINVTSFRQLQIWKIEHVRFVNVVVTFDQSNAGFITYKPNREDQDTIFTSSILTFVTSKFVELENVEIYSQKTCQQSCLSMYNSSVLATQLYIHDCMCSVMRGGCLHVYDGQLNVTSGRFLNCTTSSWSGSAFASSGDASTYLSNVHIENSATLGMPTQKNPSTVFLRSSGENVVTNMTIVNATSQCAIEANYFSHMNVTNVSIWNSVGGVCSMLSNVTARDIYMNDVQRPLYFLETNLQLSHVVVENSAVEQIIVMGDTSGDVHDVFAQNVTVFGMFACTLVNQDMNLSVYNLSFVQLSMQNGDGNVFFLNGRGRGHVKFHNVTINLISSSSFGNNNQSVFCATNKSSVSLSSFQLFTEPFPNPIHTIFRVMDNASVSIQTVKLFSSQMKSIVISQGESNTSLSSVLMQPTSSVKNDSIKADQQEKENGLFQLEGKSCMILSNMSIHQSGGKMHQRSCVKLQDLARLNLTSSTFVNCNGTYGGFAQLQGSSAMSILNDVHVVASSAEYGGCVGLFDASTMSIADYANNVTFEGCTATRQGAVLWRNGTSTLQMKNMSTTLWNQCNLTRNKCVGDVWSSGGNNDTILPTSTSNRCSIYMTSEDIPLSCNIRGNGKQQTDSKAFSTDDDDDDAIQRVANGTSTTAILGAITTLTGDVAVVIQATSFFLSYRCLANTVPSEPFPALSNLFSDETLAALGLSLHATFVILGLCGVMLMYTAHATLTLTVFTIRRKKKKLTTFLDACGDFKFPKFSTNYQISMTLPFLACTVAAKEIGLTLPVMTIVVASMTVHHFLSLRYFSPRYEESSSQGCTSLFQELGSWQPKTETVVGDVYYGKVRQALCCRYFHVSPHAVFWLIYGHGASVAVLSSIPIANTEMCRFTIGFLSVFALCMSAFLFIFRPYYLHSISYLRGLEYVLHGVIGMIVLFLGKSNQMRAQQSCYHLAILQNIIGLTEMGVTAFHTLRNKWKCGEKIKLHREKPGVEDVDVFPQCELGLLEAHTTKKENTDDFI